MQKGFDNMDFLDEKIIEARRKEAQRNLDIRKDGLIVNGEKIEFQETTLFQGKMMFLLPVSFVDMPQKIAKIKYPSEQRPQIIKTDLLGSTNFAFNLFDQGIKAEQMESAADGMKAILKKVNPANIFYESGTEPLGNSMLSWFEFKGHGIDTQIYYIIFLTSIDGKLMHGIFNCAIKDMENWKEATFQVIRSIQDRTEKLIADKDKEG